MLSHTGKGTDLHRRSIDLTHNAEIAHRLLLTPGKCQRIHGHSLTIRLEMFGDVDGTGKMVGLDFREIKAAYRGEIDKNFDHSLLLNEDDPIARPVTFFGGDGIEPLNMAQGLPGLVRCAEDPTTENIAKWLAVWASMKFAVPGLYSVRVHVAETGSNGAGFECATNHLDKLEPTGILGRWK
jgi:6-pyruvoyl-tetrahydropterin synthase